MNKNLIITLLALCMSATMQAQSKLDLQSQWELMGLRRQTPVTSPVSHKNGNRKVAAPTTLATHAMSFIRMKGADSRAELEAAGVRILRTRGNIALASIPIDDVEKVAAMKCVSKLQLARKVYPQMDRTREVIGVDKIHSGLGLPQAYTGKGVVCGIVDHGIEPNHPNFLKADGSTRFGYMGKITASAQETEGYKYEDFFPRAELAEYEGKYMSAIEDYKTDDNTSYHGTHTLGIMAGSYKGNVTHAVVSEADPTKSVISEVANPYYGCATDAELVASTGDFDSYDIFIAYGVEDCINYATYSNDPDEEGNPVPKPCVVNLSIGRTLGPHDPNALINQYLKAAGNDAIICIASGNEADYPICLNKTFSENDTEVKSFIRPMIEGKYPDDEHDIYNLRSGAFYAYSDDATEFVIQLVIYNAKTGSIAYRMSVNSSTAGTYNLWASSEEYASSAIYNQTFKKAFDGYVALGSSYDEDSGRYYAIAQYFTMDNQETNKDGDYKLGVVIRGKDGQRVRVYGDAQYTYFDSYGKTNWVDGTKDGTISDLAIGDSIIVVGAYNNRTDWGCLDGGVSNYAGKLTMGDVAVYSSYGTLDDGRTLPHICAPGTAVVSSMNKSYIENKDYKITTASLSGQTQYAGNVEYWAASTGTSMSCPVVAGSIALWLEADPTLTYGDIVDILKKTAVVDENVKKGPAAQWGFGKFDAYEGLKEVLRRKDPTGIAGVRENQRVLLSPVGEHAFQVFLAGAKALVVNVYNSLGQVVLTEVADGDETMVNASLPQGVYFVKVNNSAAQKIVIK